MLLYNYSAMHVMVTAKRNFAHCVAGVRNAAQGRAEQLPRVRRMKMLSVNAGGR
jgi:hypothetical protein